MDVRRKARKGLFRGETVMTGVSWRNRNWCNDTIARRIMAAKRKHIAMEKTELVATAPASSQTSACTSPIRIVRAGA